MPIRGTEGAGYPFFSPDGEWVGFFADGKLKKVALAGGLPVTLCDAGYRSGASWGPQDVIVFAVSGSPGLMRVSASGGSPELITTPDNEQERHRWLDFLPGGRAVLFTVWRSLEMARIAVHSLETGEMRVLVDGTHPRYAPTGHIVFAREGSLWTVPFDADRLEVTGSATPVLEGVRVNSGGLANFAIAGNGSLVYMPGEVPLRTLVSVDRGGNVTPLTEKPGDYGALRLSPDGDRLALEVHEGRTRDIFIYDMGRSTLSRLTTGGINRSPLWSPDGQWVAFSSGRLGDLDLYRKRANFSGAVEPILTREHGQYPSAWSPDGTLLAYNESVGRSGDIWVVPLEGESEPLPILNTSFDERSLAFSPDGRWIVYDSDESGRFEVFVQPFPGPGRRWPVSTDGGSYPVWSATGGEIFYLNGQRLMAVDVETEPEFRAGVPRLAFDGSQLGLSTSSYVRDYDVTPDGQTFVMLQTEEGSTPDQLHVVLNWFDELKTRPPTDP